MIRWTYLIPRLLVLLPALLFLAFGIAPLLHWALVTAGTQAVGAKVEIAAVEVSVPAATIALRGVAVADPSAPLNNLVQVEQARLELDGAALLNRRLVVRSGAVHGIRCQTARLSSGAIERETEATDDGDAAAEQLLGWLEACGERLEEKLDEDLQSPRLCRELMRRWPEEVSQVEDRVARLRERVERLRRATNEIRRGKLPTQPEDVRRMADDLQQLRREIQAIPEEVARLQTQVKRDHTAVDAARRHDLEYVRQRLRLDGIERGDFTRYLLDEEQARRLDEVVAWLEWMRRYVPEKRELAEPIRSRGRTLVFGVSQRAPDWVCEHLEIQGEALLGTDRYVFAGQLDGLTLQPSRYGQPTRLRLETSGPQPLSLEAVFDRRGQRPIDVVNVRCPSLTLPDRTFGDREALAVEVAAGAAAWELAVQLTGQEMTGRLALVQPDVRVQATLAPRLGGERLQGRVNEALSAVRSFDLAIDLSGTLRRPRARLQTPLGRDLAAGLQQAATAELAVQADRLAARLESEADAQLARVDELVQKKSAEIAERLELPREQVAELAAALPLGDASRLAESIRTGQLPVPPWLRR